MDFLIKNKNSIVDLSRKIGYVIIDTTEKGEYNMVRKLHLDNYPRFHVYLKLQKDNYIFSLHLDQKKPVYKTQKSVPAVDSQYDWRRGQDFTGEGGHAHNGEYFGPVVEEEADRIKEILI